MFWIVSTRLVVYSLVLLKGVELEFGFGVRGVAMAAPLGPKMVVPVEAGNGPASTPTIQVPAMMSRHDMIMLFSREIPLATAKPVAEGATPAWALKTNLVVKTAATEVREATTNFENLFHTIMPHGSGDDSVTLKASVTIQKKLLVLDLSDLVADSGDDLAEVIGQHVSIQLVSNKIDPSASNAPFAIHRFNTCNSVM